MSYIPTHSTRHFLSSLLHFFPSLLLPQIKGEAEAFAVEAKGRAEAEQMAKKAEAFQQYKEGAMVDMLLEKIPMVRPLGHGVVG